MKVLEGQVCWKSKDEGCLEEPFSGIRPSFSIGGDLILSFIKGIDGVEKMEREKCYPVMIELPYGERYESYLSAGTVTTLHVGERIIGTVMVEKIIS